MLRKVVKQVLLWPSLRVLTNLSVTPKELVEYLSLVLQSTDYQALTLQEKSNLWLRLEDAITEALRIEITEWFSTDRRRLQELITSQLGCKAFIMDSTYKYTWSFHTESIIIVDWTSLKRYVPEIRDCDNFAFLFREHLAWDYGINAVGVVIGSTPYGYHAWNVILVKDLVTKQDKLIQIEPQRDWMDVEKRGYKPEFVII